MSNLFDLTGRTALVTGASRGLGRRFAAALARAGADVIITSRQLASLEEPRKEIEALGRKVSTSGGDITIEADVDAMVKKATSELGKVDILVNNAGVTTQERFADMPIKRWNLIINVNLTGTAICAHAVLPQMIVFFTLGVVRNVIEIDKMLSVRCVR